MSTRRNRMMPVICGAACLLLSLPAAWGAAGTASLNAGEQLEPGESLTLPNGERILSMQSDGNLVLYGRAARRLLWQSGTSGNPGATYVMQGDGNLVVYSADGAPLWASDTYGNPDSRLVLEDNGNVAIYSAPRRVPLWASGTDGHPGAYYRMQEDGNLVVYSAEDAPLWASNTNGHAGAVLVVDDGNLLIYSESEGAVLWQTGTGGHPGSELVMQDDGNLVLVSGPDLLWESRTGGNPGAELLMRDDGNLVVLGPYQRKPIWASNTYDHPGAHASMQGDGNLVVYGTDGAPLWAADTGGHSSIDPHLELQEDGNLVLYFQSGFNDPRWATHTFLPWMEKLGSIIAGFSLRDLVIPGTHDSGSWGLDDSRWADDGNVPEGLFNIDGYLPWHVEVDGQWVAHNATFCLVWCYDYTYWTYEVWTTPHAKYVYSFAKTQSDDFMGQLSDGIRYFDLRVLYDNSNLYLIHALRGPNAFSEIDKINDYLRANPFEIVILDFQHFYTQGGDKSTIPDEWNRKLIEHIYSRFGDLMIAPPARDVRDLTVGDIWAGGKQVIVFYEQGTPDGVDTSLFWSRGDYLRNEWLNQQDLDAGGGKVGLAQAIRDEADCVVNGACKETADRKLWVVQGILTFEPATLQRYLEDQDWSQLSTWLDGNRGAADSVNGWVADWALNGGYTSDLNIVVGDWAKDAELVETAIKVNRIKAGLDP